MAEAVGSVREMPGSGRRGEAERGSGGRGSEGGRAWWSAGGREARERLLLRRIETARACGDELAARCAAGELLCAYIETVRDLIAWRTRGRQVSFADREDMWAAAMERLVRVLARPDPGRWPFGMLVALSVKCSVDDYYKLGSRRAAVEAPVDPGALSEVGCDMPTKLEQARDVGEMLGGLGRREREVVLERLLLGFNHSEIAARHGISEEAVKRAGARGLKKLREAVGSG